MVSFHGDLPPMKSLIPQNKPRQEGGQIRGPLCFGGECIFFSIANGSVSHFRRPANDERRPRQDLRVRLPPASTIFSPCLCVSLVNIFPSCPWCLGGEYLSFAHPSTVVL
jgi:hypothetical protein